MKPPKTPAIAMGIKIKKPPMPMAQKPPVLPQAEAAAMIPYGPKKPLTGPQKAAIKYRDKSMGK